MISNALQISMRRMYVSVSISIIYLSPDYNNCFGILMYCLDDPMEKLLLFRLSGGGGVACGPEVRAEVVQQLSKLMAASIFSTDTVRSNASYDKQYTLLCT